MKVKFIAEFKGVITEEVVDINEEKIKGNGFYPKNMIYCKLQDWATNKLNTSFQIIDDDRFEDEEDNMPYIDEVTKKRIGW